MKGFVTMIFILFAVIAVSIGYMNYNRVNEKWQNCTEETDGIVVGFKEKISMSSSDRILFPIFEYYVDGKGYRITSGSGTNRQKLKEGQAVTIRYNPDKPKQMLIEGYNNKSTMYLCMAIMAMGVAIPVCSIRMVWKST